ncbi:MAG TPA: ATP-binding cassette domain-containing protein [Candidatus Bathyarchaeia archaeon]|nr:ATP-binding cassette domain-containing protein [Candidatus Bathyarchaeia archaeon]
MINLEAVTKIYPNPKLGRSIVALNGCDLDIKEGSFVSIIGPSGAGKSTLMRMLSGLEQPTSGKVNILSRDIDLMSKMGLYNFRLQNIGFLNQIPQYNLFPELTVEQNLMVPSRLLGVGLEESKKQIDEILEKMEIKHLSLRRAKHLSMGESMRVSLAVSLVNSPPILLADEPTGQLDKKNTKVILDLLKKINQEEKTTIIVVSHDPIYFSVVSESFLIFNGRLGAIYSQEDLPEEEEENKPLTSETFVSHIDSYSYLYLPNEIKKLLSLDKKVKFIVDHEMKKIYLENPDSSNVFELKESQHLEKIHFELRKRDKSEKSILNCKGLTKYYYSPQKELILKDLNFQLYPGELVFLIGPSGTGKSTLLNLISGIDSDFDGSITVFDEEITSTNRSIIDKIRSQKMYYSSQYINLYPSMSLIENINYFTFNKKEQQNNYELDYLLQYLLLDNIKNQLVENYSQGEKKRASILLGLLLSPEIMLVDEPTANLDEINKNRVLNLLAEHVMKTKASVLAVTHDLLSILPNSRVIHIENNKIASDTIVTQKYCDNLKELYFNKKLVSF